MKKAKDEIKFDEYWNELLERLKKEGKEFIHEIDFDKVWSLIEKRITKCKDRRNARKAK
jgi:hypothetical protein